MANTAPYGSWKSPITADKMASKSIEISFPRFFEGRLYWTEFRPHESARSVVVRQGLDNNHECLIPDGFSAQTKAHEYGGICYTVGGGALFFVNAKDQRIYKQTLTGALNNEPVPISPDFSSDGCEYRYADLIYDAPRSRIVAVAEVHDETDEQPRAQILALSLESGEISLLASGADFYANPRLSHAGSELLWIQWNHPNMPWDSTELYRAKFDSEGGLSEATKVAGKSESIFQPEWSPTDEIYYVSDRSGWWNLYKLDRGNPTPIWEGEFECGLPLWQFGMSTWGFIDDHNIALAYCRGGSWKLSTAAEATPLAALPALSQDRNHLNYVVTDPASGKVALVASGPYAKGELLVLSKDETEVELVSAADSLDLDREDISVVEEISFPTTEGDSAHGYFYAPTNSAYAQHKGERPPLIVLCHGGPTASTSAAFNLKVQFWTSRGFAVVDVNYRGSTGYGRAYRDKLYGNWGVFDVDDACAAAEFAVNKGWADPDRLIIRGSSAGGYSVLSALCFRDRFSAGCSLYGIGDLTALAAHTHKFEARYTDNLVAPLEDTEVYEARSPLNHIQGFDCPTIFFQGLKDKVVPPEQAQSMFDALDQKQIPVSLVTYENEAHGFRNTENVVHAFNTELAFYGRVFGFNTDSTVNNLDIHNLDER